MSVLGNRRYDPYENIWVKLIIDIPGKGIVYKMVDLESAEEVVMQFAEMYGMDAVKYTKVTG